MTTNGRVQQYWDRDAVTYDRSPSHTPRSAAERAAWRASLRQLLPAPPARVLDVGAGTGFLSLLLCELGYQVTALDLSAAMLDVLSAKARAAGFGVEIAHGDATQPPVGPFDAVVERHLLWTLPDPAAALDAWRAAAPTGRLVLVESVWGDAAHGLEKAGEAVREQLHRLRRHPPDHHAPYETDLQRELPLGAGTQPAVVAALVDRSRWGSCRLHRLRDVEWAITAAAGMPERLLGTHPRFAVVAGA